MCHIGQLLPLVSLLLCTAQPSLSGLELYMDLLVWAIVCYILCIIVCRRGGKTQSGVNARTQILFCSGLDGFKLHISCMYKAFMTELFIPSCQLSPLVMPLCACVCGQWTLRGSSTVWLIRPWAERLSEKVKHHVTSCQPKVLVVRYGAGCVELSTIIESPNLVEKWTETGGGGCALQSCSGQIWFSHKPFRRGGSVVFLL